MRLWPIYAACSAVLSVSTAPAVAQSIGVEPLFLQIEPTESSAMRVRNSSDKPVTVEILVEARSIDENGVQTRTDAEDDFILFPPQAVVAPSSLQVFRLQPLTPDLTKSKSYFVTVKQVPVRLGPIEGGGARVQLVFAFDAAVHVVPRNAKAEPVIIDSAIDRTKVLVATGEFRLDDKGIRVPVQNEVEVPAIAVTIRNDGNKFFYLQDLQFSGTLTGGTATGLPDWTEAEVIGAAKVTLVPPGATRRFKLPLTGGQQPTGVSFAASLKSGR